jgi:hypothetical protein
MTKTVKARAQVPSLTLYQLWAHAASLLCTRDIAEANLRTAEVDVASEVFSRDEQRVPVEGGGGGSNGGARVVVVAAMVVVAWSA